MHKFYAGSLPSVCVMEEKDCTGFGVGCACLPFSIQISATNPRADLDSYIGKICVWPVFSKTKIQPPVETEERFPEL